jgi:hypothetical protein
MRRFWAAVVWLAALSACSRQPMTGEEALAGSPPLLGSGRV